MCIWCWAATFSKTDDDLLVVVTGLDGVTRLARDMGRSAGTTGPKSPAFLIAARPYGEKRGEGNW
jgi:hypothetical protein